MTNEINENDLVPDNAENRQTEFVRIDVQRPGEDDLCIVRSHDNEQDSWPMILAYSVGKNNEEIWSDADGNVWEVNSADEWMHCPR